MIELLAPYPTEAEAVEHARRLLAEDPGGFYEVDGPDAVLWATRDGVLVRME